MMQNESKDMKVLFLTYLNTVASVQIFQNTSSKQQELSWQSLGRVIFLPVSLFVANFLALPNHFCPLKKS